MKKCILFILVIGLCTALAACTKNQATEDEKKEEVSNTRNAYYTALEEMIKNHTLPDGVSFEVNPQNPVGGNKFSIYDVDQDGKEELILMYNDTYSAEMKGYVFAYDAKEKELKTEFSEFPSLTFYDNGVIKVEWSHNQGLAGDQFWPYTLYRYDSASERYQLIGMVDAWDKSFSERDSQNNPFPSGADTSSTGVVYYIMKDETYDNTHPVDVSEYKNWLDKQIGSAAELPIQYLDLTEENLLQIKK